MCLTGDNGKRCNETPLRALSGYHSWLCLFVVHQRRRARPMWFELNSIKFYRTHFKLTSHTDSFARCSVPGPALHKMTRAGYKQTLSAASSLCLHAAVSCFPRVRVWACLRPECDLTPWSGSSVSIFPSGCCDNTLNRHH